MESGAKVLKDILERNSTVLQSDMPDKGVCDEFTDSEPVRSATRGPRDLLDSSDTELRARERKYTVVKESH